MTTEVIFYTQIVSIIGFIITLFVLYRVLVQQKDAVIQLLKERLIDKDEQIAALKTQTPDALASALSDRIKISVDELARLKTDGHTRLQAIEQKEEELRSIQHRLGVLADLIQGSDLVCTECGAPLVQREEQSKHMDIGGREYDFSFEFRRYECGLSVGDEEEFSPCAHRAS